MAGARLLRQLVNEQLTAAAEQIFRLVERTIEEYQDEVVRSRKEVIQLKIQLEQLSVLKPEVILTRKGGGKLPLTSILTPISNSASATFDSS